MTLLDMRSRAVLRRMLCALAAALSTGFGTAVDAAPLPRSCADPEAIGLARVVEIDAAKGHVYGGITQAPAHHFLKAKEVVLTFDDGPFAGLTRRILDTLDQHCTRATFFVVGQMAVARPEIVRETIGRGHTVGTHTWSHPMPMRALPVEAQIEEIDKGIAAASRVAGRGLAPFFRFPGLGDSPETLAHLKTRGIATFTVDIVSNDSFISDPQKLADRTMNILAGKGRGILLFHDIKPATAAALPIILGQLKQQGYQVVHMTPRGSGSPVRPPTRPVTPPHDPPAMALSNAPAYVPSPHAAAQQPERLPWGLAHPGPMPTIVPRPGMQDQSVRSSPSDPMAARPAPRSIPPPRSTDWVDSIFGGPGSS